MGKEISETVEEFEYPLTAGYVWDLIKRYLRMVGRLAKRPPEQNLTFLQLAKWYDLPNGKLGKSRLQRFKIGMVVRWNLVSATCICLLISRRVKVPVKWALKLDVLATDFYIDDLINRHKTRPEKVEKFMCLEDVLNIPIVVADHNGKLYIEDGNHRYVARARRGFQKVRVILI